MTFRINYGELVATREKIEKINARAAKRGFTGRLAVEAERVEEKITNAFGFETTKIYYETKITGEPPKYHGWTLLATLDFDPNAGLIVRTAPGVEKVNRDGLKSGWCDHCQTSRQRNKIYLVGNDAGDQLQVGSTCIKDFLGWSGTVVFYNEDDVERDVEAYLSGGGYSDPEYLTTDVLAAAWAAIQVYGFVPANGYGPTTKDTVFDILSPRSNAAREEADKLRPYVEKSYGQAKIVRDFILSDRFSGDSEYVINLKAIARAEYTTGRNVGFLASAPQAWARAEARDLVRKAEKEELINEYAGQNGDKIENLEVKIKYISFFPGNYGTTTLYTMIGKDRHSYKWFASSSVLGTETDKSFVIKGTVKGHDEWKGVKSTLLTRCKKIKDL